VGSALTMPVQDVNVDNPGSLPRVLSFLNEKNIKYRVSYFSPSFAETEIERELTRLGMGLLEGVPVEVSGQGLILAIIPSTLALHLSGLSNLFAPSQVRLLTSGEICQRFSIKHLTDILPPVGGLYGLESFLSPLIEQHHTVGFFVDSRNTLITLEASEFRRIVSNASAMQIPTRSKYRAYATPGRKAFKRCILGVSLESEEFYATKLITITDWIRRHYADCEVMLGDGLHRITLQLDSSVGENEALERSKWLARDFAYSNLSIFNLRESDCRFDFVFCSEIQNTHDYRNYYGQLRDVFRDDKEFQNSVEVFSVEFLRRKTYRQHSDKHLELSCQYLLEELAVICCLAQASPCTFVYPGSLTILEEIAGGKHPSVPACLLQIDYVELKLKGR
jgi:tRNA-dependent cyclodipeptide synthase